MENNLLSIIDHHVLDSEPYFSILHLEVTKHVVLLWISCALVFFFLFYTSRNVSKTKLFAFVDVIISFIRGNVLFQNFPDQDVRKWTPFFVSLFLFILTSNLLGLLPFSSTITGNISVNIVLASFTLILTISYGIKTKGFSHYILGLVPSGMPPVIWPFLFVIEVVSLLTKPVPLFIRLFANMIGGHIMMLVFLYLIVNSAHSFSQLFIAPISVITIVAISVFEIFICFLQAYIFTLLSAIFIGLAAEKH